MHFIDEIDFVTTFCRSITHIVAQLSDIFDAVVARAVDFDDIKTIASGNFPAVVALSAWRDRRAFLAVERFRQDPGCRCFADAARSDEQIGMRQAALLDGILQGSRHMRLPDQLVESLWAVFSSENLVTHALNLNAPAHP